MIITVDVSGLTANGKCRVQDAFFKLGYVWALGGNSYQNTDDNVVYYTNSLNGVVSNLMYTTEGFDKTTHTAEELFALTNLIGTPVNTSFNLNELNSDQLLARVKAIDVEREELLLEIDRRGFTIKGSPLDTPLTTEWLSSNRWFLNDVSIECYDALVSVGLTPYKNWRTDFSSTPTDYYVDSSGDIVRTRNVSDNLPEIVRKGYIFYLKNQQGTK